ncbi:glycerol-3-phosphate acyltransferase [Paenactinomyces guangxiensis]|uniref:Glycerol-3-phosphate acyltransferase n=1 Tax=Paenactinomyces guangxiensis TaxID=1490290 RepID=A0A7W2A9D7_9BACL|nr:glycerol-3-phosphate acyltransferase [Paenactinomyces guangxiensis]MBA4494808.1 glycerol-3-phosphate acyltransferase [Paenactinomyces guangxiensis]MBH8591891.1 glycerol-3-phosphate acyltransferase [Paenactinomyces guangxiensis]
MNILVVIGVAYLIGALPLHSWLLPTRRAAFSAPSFSALHRQEAFALVVIDLFKGIGAVLIALFAGGWFAASLAAVAVVIGSMYSLFFQGGKGVAVAAGALFVLSPLLVFIAFLSYLLSLFITRARMISAALAVIALICFGILLATHFYVWLVLFCLGIILFIAQKPAVPGFRRRWKPVFRFKKPFR